MAARPSPGHRAEAAPARESSVRADRESAARAENGAEYGDRRLRELARALTSPRLRGLALALAVTYAFFIGRPAWNQNSRFALTRALVEHKSPIIDADHATTGDKSRREGHFYSDKAPGLSVLATVPYGLFYLSRRLSGRELPRVEVVPLDPIDLAAERAPPPDRMKAGDRLRYNRAWRIAAYLCRVFAVVPIALMGSLALFAIAFLLAREQLGVGEGAARRLAIYVSGTYALATPAFAYATGFYGHRPAADLLLVAATAIYLWPTLERRARAAEATAATAMGLAVCIEYTAAPMVLLLIGWGVARCGVGASFRVALMGLPFALALAAYHHWAFGGPLQTGYDFVYLETFAAGMRVQYGIHAPELEPAMQLLFGSYRGIFALAPVLALGLWGWTQLRGPLRWIGLAVFTYYWLLNAGYYMWDGGAAAGPRHMLPAFPWIALGLIPAYARLPRATFALAAWSALQALLLAYAGPEAPTWGHPVWQYAFFEFASFDAPSSSSASNLGRFLGLPGFTSLLPLLLVWLSLVPKDPRKS